MRSKNRAAPIGEFVPSRRKSNQYCARASWGLTMKQICGAKTRCGKQCQRKLLLRGSKCPNHGGLSTGPRTQAGRNRVSEAQVKRWAKMRLEVQKVDTQANERG